MDETFNQDELSAEDQEILHAFDALDMEDWAEAPPLPPETETVEMVARIPTRPLTLSMETDALSPEDMLVLFIGEVEEDLSIIQRTLQQLEPDDELDTAYLRVIQRTANKIKGTAVAIGCTVMSTIASRMEVLSKQTS